MEEPEKYQECRVILKDIRTKIRYRLVEDVKIQKNEDISDHNCKICDKKFTLTSNLSTHLKNVHPHLFKNIIECKICQQKFIKKSALKNHMKIKHFDGKINLFECDFCGKLIKAKSDLIRHMHVHLPTVTCNICQAELKLSSINLHLKLIHATNQKFQCSTCRKIFKSPYALRTHEKIHDRKFQCTTCMKTFPQKSYLIKHQKQIHENSASHSCEICNKKFNQKNNLTRHQKIHDKYRIKSYKCERCGYATDDKSNYVYHMKSHQRKDEKIAAMKNPLKCSKCPNLYKNKDALYNHLKAVHPDQPFQCDLCGRYLKIFSGLKNHMRVYHQRKNL